MRRNAVWLLLLIWIAAAMVFRTAYRHVLPAYATGAPEQVIIIDADNQRLTLYEKGEVIKRYAVAVGTNNTPSPLGVWKITQMRKNWGSGFGTRWLGINCPWGIYGIHGTNKPGSIGTYASHGCVRMLNRDVEDLYTRVEIGTPVIIERAAFGDLAGPVRNLEPGDRGSDVRQLQIRLKNQGFDPGSIDGVYGEGTKRMLIEYKRSVGLPISHTVDYQTRLSLGMVLFE